MNQRGIELVKSFEGFRSNAYLCPAGKATIGYGSTFYPDGRKVSLQDPPITKEKATFILVHILHRFEMQVKSVLHRPVNENQLSALVSFAYNVGMGNFTRSTLLKRVNSDPHNPMIREEFMKWKFARVNGVQTVLPGLVRRRVAEANLYFGI